MPLPTKRDASRARRRARVDEGIAIVQVVHARLRKRYAEAALAVLDGVETVRKRAVVEERAARSRVADWLSRAQRAIEGDRATERGPRRSKRS